MDFKLFFIRISFLTLLFACSTDESIAELPRNNSPKETLEVINVWTLKWLELDRYALAMRPNGTARSLAYIHLAAYETVVANLNGYISNTDKLPEFDIDFSKRKNNINFNLALSTCYANVVNHFIKKISATKRDEIEALKIDLESKLSKKLTNLEKQNSIDWGNYISNTVITYSQTDTDAEKQITYPQPVFYDPPTGQGYWTYGANEERALFPFWDTVRTFVISPRETTSIAPPILYSTKKESTYYKEMQEVCDLNDLAKENKNENLWIAEFWSDDVESVMLSPPGRQISIGLQLINKYNLEYNGALAMLLKLGFSLNDTAVSTWTDKYKYMVMRPSVYIQEHIDEDFETNLFKFIYWPNPSFPGYPSGHSAFASAAAGIFIKEFGDTTDFTDRTHQGRTEFMGTPRHFNSFKEMAKENAYSRIPLGVHMRMDCTEGLRLGYEISDALNTYNLKK